MRHLQAVFASVLLLLKMRRVYFEFFSRAPGDISDLAPAVTENPRSE